MSDKLKKRVLLINAPFYILMNSHFNGLSLGLSDIAATLTKNGHYVRIYNADCEPNEKYADLRKIFEGYDTYKKILSNLDHPPSWASGPWAREGGGDETCRSWVTGSAQRPTNGRFRDESAPADSE